MVQGKTGQVLAGQPAREAYVHLDKVAKQECNAAALLQDLERQLAQQTISHSLRVLWMKPETEVFDSEVR